MSPRGMLPLDQYKSLCLMLYRASWRRFPVWDTPYNSAGGLSLECARWPASHAPLR